MPVKHGSWIRINNNYMPPKPHNLFRPGQSPKNNRPIKYDVCIGQIDLAPGQTPKIQPELFIFMALALAGPGLF